MERGRYAKTESNSRLVPENRGTKHREAVTLLNYIVLNNVKCLSRAIILGRERAKRASWHRLTGSAQLILRNLAKYIRGAPRGERGEGMRRWGSFFVSRRFRAKQLVTNEKREKETTPLAPPLIPVDSSLALVNRTPTLWDFWVTVGCFVRVAHGQSNARTVSVFCYVDGTRRCQDGFQSCLNVGKFCRCLDMLNVVERRLTEFAVYAYNIMNVIFKISGDMANHCSDHSARFWRTFIQSTRTLRKKSLGFN